jgi:hypothetical protein
MPRSVRCSVTYRIPTARYAQFVTETIYHKDQTQQPRGGSWAATEWIYMKDTKIATGATNEEQQLTLQ